MGTVWTEHANFLLKPRSAQEELASYAFNGVVENVFDSALIIFRQLHAHYISGQLYSTHTRF